MTGSQAPTLRLGVAGLGRMGSRHLAALLRRDDVDVCAVADPSALARSQARSMMTSTPRFYNDAEEMIAAQELDAIVIATPPDTHARQALSAVRAGLAVLVEKPIATTVDDGARLVRAAEEAGVLLMVGHIERFNPAVQAVHDLLSGLPIGKILLIETWRHGQPLAVLPVEGVGLDLAVHDVDLICQLLGEEPAVVRAEPQTDASDTTRLEGEMRFSSGQIARLSVAWRPGERERRMVVRCEAGTIEVDFVAQEVRHCLVPGQWYVQVWPGEPLVREHDAFLQAISNGGPSPVSGRDGLRALSLVNDLLTSASTGKDVAAPPVATG